MMAELAPQRGKFGHPWGQVRQSLLLYSQTSVVGIANGEENVTALTYGLSELVLQNTNLPKLSLNMSYQIVRVFVLLFKQIYSLNSLPNPFMPNKIKRTNKF